MTKYTLERHLEDIKSGDYEKRLKRVGVGLELYDYKAIVVSTLKDIRDAYKGKEHLLLKDIFFSYKLAEIVKFAITGMGGGLVYGDKGLKPIIDQLTLIAQKYESKKKGMY